MTVGLIDAGNYPDLVVGNYDGDSVQVIRNQGWQFHGISRGDG